jgi:hypothetical protein
LHESKIAAIEQKLKDIKGSGVKDQAANNNFDEFQQKLIAEMQRDIQLFKIFTKDTEGELKNNRREIEDLRRKLSNFGNNMGPS